MYIIEVTGVSGVGKSYFLNLLKKNQANFIYASDIVKENNLTDFKLMLIFLTSKHSLQLFILLLKISYNLNFSYFNKINFIRNSIKKIAKNTFFNTLNTDKTLIVDEGITHIYQNIVTDNVINYTTTIMNP